MNPLDTAITPAARRERPTGSLRRAFALEHKHHYDLLGLYGILAVVVIQLSWFAEIHVGFVLILLAARAPCDLVGRRHDDERLLRASLGISRADAVRTRFLMVLWCQVLLMAGAAWSILARDYGPDDLHWSSFASSPGPAALTLQDHLVDIGLWVAAIMWVHALLGGEANRPGRGPAGARAIALFIGVSIMECMLLIGVWWLVRLPFENSPSGGDMTSFAQTSSTAQLITVALALGSAVLVLLWRRRSWIRHA